MLRSGKLQIKLLHYQCQMHFACTALLTWTLDVAVQTLRSDVRRCNEHLVMLFRYIVFYFVLHFSILFASIPSLPALLFSVLYCLPDSLSFPFNSIQSVCSVPGICFLWTLPLSCSTALTLTPHHHYNEKNILWSLGMTDSINNLNKH